MTRQFLNTYGSVCARRGKWPFNVLFFKVEPGHELMCPSSWKLYVDDFPFFSSSLACLEPKLELFEVDDISDDGDDDLLYHYLANFKQL